MRVMETTKIQTPNPDPKDVEANRELAAISYVWILSVVVYALRRDSPFIRYHSKQGLVLFFASFAWFIPFLGRPLTLIVVAGCVFGFINAAQGQWKDVPVVGDIAKGKLTLEDIPILSHKAASQLKKILGEVRKKPSNAPPPQSTDQSQT